MCECFFFQAEDGIRDLVRSRGLGDVYKRQEMDYLVVENFLISKKEQPARADDQSWKNEFQLD